MARRVVDVVVGTRPETIKLAPVVHALGALGIGVRLVLTGQHREMVDDLLGPLGLADVETVRLAVMTPRQRLTPLASRLLLALDDHLGGSPAELLIVQGDTTSAMAAALAAFHAGVPVAHVEAGLRSGRLDDPFPEEMNRQMIARLATWHFCPTVGAAANLAREGVGSNRVMVTGNTSIDTLHWVRGRGLGRSAFGERREGRTRVLVTLHRRESQGETMRELATTLVELVGELDLEVVLPLHPSPAVREALVPTLGRCAAVRLVEPLAYVDFVATLAAADVVVTDSGGVQEEAPALNTPVLVVRETTERPEALAAGCARLVGTRPEGLRGHLRSLVHHPDARRAMTERGSPFGDGRAAGRIAARLVADRPALVPGRTDALVEVG